MTEQEWLGVEALQLEAMLRVKERARAAGFEKRLGNPHTEFTYMLRASGANGEAKRAGICYPRSGHVRVSSDAPGVIRGLLHGEGSPTWLAPRALWQVLRARRADIRADIRARRWRDQAVVCEEAWVEFSGSLHGALGALMELDAEAHPKTIRQILATVARVHTEAALRAPPLNEGATS